MLKTLLGAILASLVFTTSPVAATDDAKPAATSQWYRAIASGYQTLATASAEFAEASAGYCSADPETSFQSVRDTWLNAFLAWQAVRFVDFGPIETDNLAWQFQFWPDPKNLVGRKASYLMKQSQPVTAQLVAESGVAVQGFPMAEYLLFDEQLAGSERALPAAACNLLSAVAKHIRNNSQTLAGDWLAFRDPYLGNDQYRETTIRAAMAALEILEERRLAEPMGLRGNGKRSAYGADAWRSGTSTRAIEATLRGIQTYFMPGLRHLLEKGNQPALADRIRAQFDKVLENFTDLHAPMRALLSQEESYRKLQGLYVDLSQLVNLVNEQAAAELGVVRGFNSSDGD